MHRPSLRMLSVNALFSALLFSGFSAFAQMEDSTVSANESRRAGGLFVEPLIQYEDSDSEIKSSQLPLISDDTSGTMKGLGIGLRLGGHVGDVIFLAADARYSQVDLKDSFYESASSTGYNYGATLGAQTPFFGVRVWGTYVLGGELNPDSGVSDLDLKFKDAKGHRLGAGLHFAAVAVNLEYQDLKYDRTEIESLGSTSLDEDTNIDTTQKGLILSLGFPIEF